MPPNTLQDIEQKSSAITLSDMEMFVFPGLMYSLVLANIMSPCLWRWRDDPWFDGLERMKPYRRISRLKQYIMDHYAFNLDLDTWGLTTKEQETARFSSFIKADTLKKSNALFGYEGDKYYFDIDIRTHFGLNKYEGNIIPYWKTETVEAMDAFRLKPNYATGAGECVSLAALYAAALFVVARVPLESIYLMTTPLHSQNFVDIDDGLLTNNRRLLTKTMWFNGTELSTQARRALENEHVTGVSHVSGYIHTIYNEASIDEKSYSHFVRRLQKYLRTCLTPEIIGNFLRSTRAFQKCFQIKWPVHGTNRYIGLEKVFAYEHGSSYKITNRTRDKLLNGIDSEEFQLASLPDRIVLNEMEEFIQQHIIDLNEQQDFALLQKQFSSNCLQAQNVLEDLRKFCHVEPMLPVTRAKKFIQEEEPLRISLNMTRAEIIRHLENIRMRNATADLAFYAYRDLSRTNTLPFLLAAIQRNPVSITATIKESLDSILAKIKAMPDISIYDAPERLAQPDEVWNYNRGDGLEKALLLANILRSRKQDERIVIEVTPKAAVVITQKDTYCFESRKKLKRQTWIIPLNKHRCLQLT